MRSGAVRRAAALLTATVSLVACGAEAVDIGTERDVLVATCESLIERSGGEQRSPVDAEALADALVAEPGGPEDETMVATIRRVCGAAQRPESTARP